MASSAMRAISVLRAGGWKNARFYLNTQQPIQFQGPVLRRYTCFASFINADSVQSQGYNKFNQSGNVILLRKYEVSPFPDAFPHRDFNTRHFSTQTNPKHKELDQEEKQSSQGNESVQDSDEKSGEGKDAVPEEPDLEQIYDVEGDELKKLSLWQRYKVVLKQYGKVMIPVHLATSSVWYGSFYYIVKHSGINMVPLIEKFIAGIGVGESVLSAINSPTSSALLIAYAMYKIATPARYTVTLMSTTYAVRILRGRGYMARAPPQDKTFREAVKESVDDIKDRSKKRIEKRKAK